MKHHKIHVIGNSNSLAFVCIDCPPPIPSRLIITTETSSHAIIPKKEHFTLTSLKAVGTNLPIIPSATRSIKIRMMRVAAENRV